MVAVTTFTREAQHLLRHPGVLRLVDRHAARPRRLRLRRRGRAPQLERDPRRPGLLADGLGQRADQRARPARQRRRPAVGRHRPQQLRDPDRPDRRDLALLRDQRDHLHEAPTRRIAACGSSASRTAGRSRSAVARLGGRRAAAARRRRLPLALLVVERRHLPGDRRVRLPDLLRRLLLGLRHGRSPPPAPRSSARSRRSTCSPVSSSGRCSAGSERR